MDELGIQAQIWAPFAEGMKGMFEEPILKEIAEKIAGLDKDCPSMLDTRKISEVRRVYDYFNNPVLTSL